MKKNVGIVIGIVVVIVLVAVGFAVMHKPAKKTTTSTTKGAVSVVNNAVLKTKTDATVGQYLTDPGGKALYTYGGDTADVSNCTGSCLSNWPAYQATSSSASLPTGVTVITRSDNGQLQYAYNGMPLYYFTSDGQGQVTGDGVNDFSAATPAAAAQPTATPSTDYPY